MPNKRKKNSRTSLVLIVLPILIMVSVFTYLAIPKEQVTVNDAGYPVITDFLSKVQIKIYGQATYYRSMTDPNFSAGLAYYGFSNLGWYSAFVRIDDADIPSMVDAKADVIMGIYYNPTNSPDNRTNGWGNVPEITVDGAMFGSYHKDLIINGVVVWSYSPSSGRPANFWLLYNVNNGTVQVY